MESHHYGWWPATDWVDWLALLKRVIRPHNPQADIVFWTYNWGYAPEADRLALIRALPPDVTLQATFEMFEAIKREHVTSVCVDYTVSFEGPGRYFAGEAAAAHERGLTLYAMSNTGGLTWDLGVIPYEPVPFQWARRHAALLDAHRRWGLSGLMESHHYGWWPSVVSDLAKWAYWTPSPSSDEVCARLARRDFGAGADDALAAWRDWSAAIRDYVPTREDQYGPFRIGPAYPLVFRLVPEIPAASFAMFGARIVVADYQPREGRRPQSTGAARFPVEIRCLERMAARWQRGVERLAAAVALAPARRRAEAERMLALGRFVVHAVRTTIHLKRWWLLKQRLWGEPDSARAHAVLDELVALAETEIANTAAAIPLVEADSRLGWEPSMDYMADAAHLRWKIAQVRRVVDAEIPAYREMLNLTDPADLTHLTDPVAPASAAPVD
jgi:hypothetical protein